MWALEATRLLPLNEQPSPVSAPRSYVFPSVLANENLK